VIESIKLRAGGYPGANGFEIPAEAITIFVGPNNSGKSSILREIQSLSTQGSAPISPKVLQEVTLSLWSSDEFLEELQKYKVEPENGESEYPGQMYIGSIVNGGYRRVSIHIDSLRQQACSPGPERSLYRQQFMPLMLLTLDSNSRMVLSAEQSAGDFQKEPHSQLAYLARNDQARQKIRDIIYDAFQKYFVIDPTNIGSLRIRFAESAPTHDLERSFSDDAINYFKRATLLSEMSDGIKSFTGIIASMFTGEPRVILIDEPEAFLYPPLAALLGREIAGAAQLQDKKVFASTHNSNFLMGCIQSGAPINIVRLTYTNQTATARLLPRSRIVEMMRRPLLRSTKVLEALFYEFVIVTEADTDRAFYQEVNERLLSGSDDRGIKNCLFLNAQNKQTIWEIVDPLRTLGIPTAAIVDIDAIKDGGRDFVKMTSGSFIPTILHSGLQNTRSNIKAALDNTGKDMKRDGGIKILQGQEKAACRELFEQFANYGTFFVPNGEVESWLSHLGVGGHGSYWLVPMFERMGDDPNSPDYIKPSQGDVWDFIGTIKSWLANPARKGIPEEN
jgi:energy-coupling factor transporter ATP-binding protein EcfA2